MSCPGIVDDKAAANSGHSGGIRGIVELEVLNHLEKALGEISIRCFFDLIVGTRLVAADYIGQRNTRLAD